MTSKSEQTFLEQKLGGLSKFKMCFQKSNLFGIVLHKGTDIEYLMSYIQDKDNVIAYDLQRSLLEILSPESKLELENALINNVRAYEVMLKSYLKKYIRSLKKIHKGIRKLIFIDSDVSLLRFIGIKPKNIIRLIPTRPILDEIFNVDKHEKNEIEKFRESREKVLSATEYVKLEYSTADQMLDQTRTFLFGVKR